LLAIEAQLKRREVLAYELRRVPGKEQKLIARTVLDHVRHRLVGAAFDATGMGWTVAEDIGRLYGLAEKEDDAGVVRAIKFSEEWYRVHMPPLKAAFEDDALAIIRDAEHLGDLRLVKLIRGIARVPPERTGGTGNQRHGDYAIGLALAHYASRQRFVEYGYRPVTGGAGGGQSFLTPADQDDRAWRRPLGSALWGVI
jgi:phage FluMu gp28-like protein